MTAAGESCQYQEHCMLIFKLFSLIIAVFLESSHKSKNAFSTNFFPIKRTFYFLTSSSLGDCDL